MRMGGGFGVSSPDDHVQAERWVGGNDACKLARCVPHWPTVRRTNARSG